MTTRYNYVIGDVQGCFEALKALLKEIQFDPDLDKLWFAGDLVARGENSVGVLRFVKKLAERGCAETVLGNHDLTLIACARGHKKVKARDNTQQVLDAIDGDELIDWLRRQPLCLFPDRQTVITHAGIPCIWTAEQAFDLACEVETYIGHDDLTQLDAFLSEMYGEAPTLWSDQLTGMDRLRAITNYLTRMRLNDVHGRLEFSFKDELTEPMPKGFLPWFDFDCPAAHTHQIFFGHWAALQGMTINERIQNVDGGCVWGRRLIAYRLEDQRAFSVQNPLAEDW